MATAATPSAASDPEHNKKVREDEEDNSPAPADDEDTGAEVAPIVKLEEVAVTTGEEDEDPILDMKAKLYRFDKEGNQWKERGVGTVKLLKHKESGKVRLVFRQSKTLKICANHLVFPTINVQEHAGNDKSCVWHAPDFADGELKNEFFCIRFASIENAKTFRETVQDAAETQGKKESQEASETAGLLEKLSVGEGKTVDEKTTVSDAAGAGKEDASDAAGEVKKAEEAEPAKKSEPAAA